MIKKLALAGIGFAMLATPFLASAQAAGNQAEIARLTALIETLLAEIAQLKGGAQTSCVTISHNLTLGSTGSDVVSLQNYLASKGYLNAKARGYYGFLTAQAVGKLQLSLGIVSSASDTAYGITGPKTRAAIACGSNPQPLPPPLPTPNPVSFTATPASGSAPLDVTFSFQENPWYLNGYSVNFGDGSKPMSLGDTLNSCKPAGPSPCQGIGYQYDTPGTYTAQLLNSSGAALATQTITVTGSTSGASAATSQSSAAAGASSPAASGTISASPNPCTMQAGASTCATKLVWSTTNAPNACVFYSADANGNPGRWCITNQASGYWPSWINANGITFTLRTFDSSSAPALGSVIVKAIAAATTGSAGVTNATVLSTPLNKPTQYWFWPNQTGDISWNPANGNIENSFADLSLWPALQKNLLQRNGGFGMWSMEIPYTSANTLATFRSMGLPVAISPPGFTQCQSMTDIANAELSGSGPLTTIFPGFNLTGKGWFVTKDAVPYTPEEIVADERAEDLLPYYNPITLASTTIGDWSARKAAAYVNTCPSASLPGVLQDYVTYAKAIQAKWPTNPPKFSFEWQVQYTWATESSTCLDTLNAEYPDPATFGYWLAHSEGVSGCMAGNDVLTQVVQTMCAAGECPNTVYMDTGFAEAAVDTANTPDYVLASLRQNKSILASFGVNFGIDIPGGTCDVIGNAQVQADYTAHPNNYVTGLALDASGNLVRTYNDGTAASINQQCQTTTLAEYDWLVHNGIIDANTRIHFISWTSAPEEIGAAVSETNQYSFASTVNLLFTKLVSAFSLASPQPASAATAMASGSTVQMASVLEALREELSQIRQLFP